MATGGHKVSLRDNWEILEVTGGLTGDTSGSTGDTRANQKLEGTTGRTGGQPWSLPQTVYWLFTYRMNETLEIEDPTKSEDLTGKMVEYHDAGQQTLLLVFSVLCLCACVCMCVHVRACMLAPPVLINVSDMNCFIF